MRPRPAITLVEVLVAIFIMAIGLLALLTLFPLGALRMATALQDDRDASAASAGANICDAFDLRHDPQYDNPPASLSTGPLFVTPPPNAFFTTPLFPASQAGAGIPVYVDPWAQPPTQPTRLLIPSLVDPHPMSQRHRSRLRESGGSAPRPRKCSPLRAAPSWRPGISPCRTT